MPKIITTELFKSFLLSSIKPLGPENIIYDCSKNNETINKLSSDKIIKIIENNL